MSNERLIDELEKYCADLENTCWEAQNLTSQALRSIKQVCAKFWGDGYVQEKLVALETVVAGSSSNKTELYAAINDLTAAVEMHETVR